MEGNNDDETEIELRIGRIIGLARFGGIIANIVEILRARSGEERNQSTNPSVGSSLSRSSLGGSPTERDMDRDGKNGISVIICCHNSVSKLPVTLAHLEAQEPPAAPWELLIMDNKSIDGSADFARRYWKSDRIPLRVVEEPRVGVRFARERGLSESRYPFLAFVDDDNWLAPDWLRTAYEIISSDESLACVGSILEPECEVPAPAWFDDFHPIYALFTPQDFNRARNPPTYLPTAGLCVRREAWETLVRHEFQFQLTGTTGASLAGVEDTELTTAFPAGWRLAVDPRLRVKHFMPRLRVDWTYLRNLTRQYGASHVLFGCLY